MTTVTKKRGITGRPSDTPCSIDTDVTVKRLSSIFDNIVMIAQHRKAQAPKESMAKTDLLYAVDMLIEHSTYQAIDLQSQEKKRLLRRAKSKMMFMEKLKENGGVLNSTETAAVLGKTKTTVRNWRMEGHLLALDIDGEFFYPTFQFTDIDTISDKGILKGVPELLKLINQFSDRMKYSFFIEKRHTVLEGYTPPAEGYTVIDILKSDPEPTLMRELERLARLYGTQDPA